jgi:hypothetical protein
MKIIGIEGLMAAIQASPGLFASLIPNSTWQTRNEQPEFLNPTRGGRNSRAFPHSLRPEPPEMCLAGLGWYQSLS